MAVTTPATGTRFEGLVLWTSDERGDLEGWERQRVAHYWNAEKNQVDTVGFFHTHPGATDNGTCEIDATIQVRLAYAKMLSDQKFAAWKSEALTTATTPEIGRTVKVVRGRKVPVGTVGEVFWTRLQPRWGRNNGMELRLGLRDAQGTVHWTTQANVEVQNPEEYLPSFEEGEYLSDSRALQQAFYSYEFTALGSNNAMRDALVNKVLAKAYPEYLARRAANAQRDADEYLLAKQDYVA